MAWLYRFCGVSIGLAVMAAPLSAADSEKTSSIIDREVAPVRNAVLEEQRRQAQLPWPTTVREELERMGRLDQVGREQIQWVNFAAVSGGESVLLRNAIGDVLEPVDAANTRRLKELLDENEGWFAVAEYGAEASSAAFHIVQHSGDSDLVRRVLPLIEPLARSGEVDPFDYAAMYDRLANREGRGQRYGTQFRCVDGKLESVPLEDPSRVEEWRVTLKLDQTFAESSAMHIGKRC